MRERVTELQEKDSEISELKRRLDSAERSLLDKDQQLSAVNRKLEQQSRDVERLVGWTDELNHGLSTILGSQRWKIGNFLGDLPQLIKLRSPAPTIAPSLKELSERIRAWRESREREQANIVEDEETRPLESATSAPIPSASPPKMGKTSETSTSNAGFSPPPNKRKAPSKLKVSVLSWDVAHNPMGRAYLIADMLSGKFDVEVVGARFPRFGNEVWEPVRNGTVPTAHFLGQSFPAHFAKMEEVAKQIESDVIFVSKPRLPSYELGILANHFRNRPLILDVDDYELSFFEEAYGGLTLEEIKERQRDDEFFNPYGRIWTQYCESIIPRADHVTVSNVELQKKYDGTILPHVKDELVFDPALYDRASIRAKYGFSADDKVILFVGTPRIHKGIVEIAEALERIGNPKYKLCIIGTVIGPELRARLERLKGDHVRLIPNQPYEDLPANLATGDLICLLQNPESEIAKYQMPSKFTDALAMEIPILATDAPPLANLASSGLVELLNGTPLDRKIEEIFSNYDVFKQKAVENREAFLADYSYSATAPKIENIILPLLEKTPPVAKEFEDLLEFHREVFSSLPSSNAQESTKKPRPESSSKVGVEKASLGRQTPDAGRSLEYVDDKYDIVFFSKQNDTGIYGRRQDMLVEYLSRSPKINRIVHFDRPMPVDFLWSLPNLGKNRKLNWSNQIFSQTISRLLKLKNSKKVKHYTFVFISPARSVNPLARLLFPKKNRYIKYIANILSKNNIGTRRTIFWVCPKNFDFPNVVKALRAQFIVADVIDDERTWFESGSPEAAERDKNYEEILGMSDLVLVNSQSVRQSMLAYSDEVHLIPNASELPDAHDMRRGKPKELKKIKGPILGYVGNLSMRIDIDLLEHVATSRPDWNIVLIGSAHSSDILERLAALKNVHFLGVKKYSDARRYIRNFDVAIIPHLDNRMTRSMNPLKLYVYCSMNVPVVTTEIENLGELRDLVYVAQSRNDFVEKIKYALGSRRIAEPSKKHMDLLIENSWERRVDTILDLIDEEFTEPSKERGTVQRIKR